MAALHEVRTAANVAVSHTVGLHISDHSCAGRPGAIAQDVRIARLFRKVLIEGQTDLTPTTMKGPQSPAVQKRSPGIRDTARAEREPLTKVESLNRRIRELRIGEKR